MLSALFSLLKPFDHSVVGFSGWELPPHTVIGVGSKRECPDDALVKSACSLWQRGQQKLAARKIALAMFSPFLSPVLNRMYRVTVHPL